MGIKISHKEIGKNNPVFIIAELSANHNQNYDLAVKTIEAVKEAGADAVKFQTYTADTITINCSNEYFQIKHGSLWDGKSLYNLYQEAYTPWDWQPKLKIFAESMGLICFSSPFDHSAVDFLEKMDVPAYKIASMEITDIPLIEYAASKQKPMIISTGIAEDYEIEEAIQACYKVGNHDVVILKCTSEYPASFSEMNLKSIPFISNKYNVPVGLSDHSMGAEAAIAAVTLGACIVEKHFIIDRALGGPDSVFSMDKKEFASMVQQIRNIESALGIYDYVLSDKIKVSRWNRRSLFVCEDIEEGEVFTAKNIRSIRPGFGLPPKFIGEILGKKAKKEIKKGTPLSWELISD